MSNKIPEATIEEILKRTDIVDLISDYLSLKQAGKDYLGLCPFHNEKTPSFSVSAEKQLYYCFGCGAGGNAVKFMMELNGTNFRETMEELGRRVGINIISTKDNQGQKSYSQLYDIMNLANAFYNTQLRKSETKSQPIEYLKQRGLDGLIAKKFQLGWAPPGWNNILEHLQEKGISDSLIDKSGLTNESRGRKFDRLRARITFPIKNRRGQVIGFGGRTLKEDKPKYLNSPETDIFHKGSTLYGIHEAVSSEKFNNLIITEGYLDVISLSQAGMTNVVATLGTAITKNQFNALFRETEHLIFCFDGDQAGKNAAIKACKLGLEMLDDNRQIDYYFLEENEDPDQLIKRVGKNDFFKNTKKMQIHELLIACLKEEFKDSPSDSQNVRLIDKAKPFIKQISGNNQKRMAIKQLSRETNFDEQILYKEILQQKGTLIGSKLKKLTNKSLTERLANLVIHYPELTKFIKEKDLESLKKLVEKSKNIKIIVDIAKMSKIKPLKASDIFSYLENSNLDRKHFFVSIPLSISDAEKELTDGVSKLMEKTAYLDVTEIYKLPFETWTDEQKEIVRRFTTRNSDEPLN